ncbi:mast cell protease 1A-like isoform X1 [Mauremys reevesii]|uniref:mast cell protease 1A-like isoform X1 n=2 Tax=Mauremys reevesii TaxID=260615 RepID=UPI0019401CB5|nr:mast cell protease 1A-like isoform X1 [Mauremys reevesii]
MNLFPPPGEIIGGREAKPHSRPYMAYLNIRREDKSVRCGGFLVSENFVLTAAHCNGEDITVLLGAHNVSRDEETQQRVSVQRKIPHPRYNSRSRENDLMLLQLVEPANLTDAVDTIPLPQAGQAVEPGYTCSVAGWGRTSLKTKTNVLHEVELEVMSNKTCQNRRHYRPMMMMCVGDPNQDKASFLGDSGGPLVCDEVAHGIVSFGKKNGSPPRVFTRVSTYIPWIETKMRGLSSPGPHVERLGPLH